MRRSSIYQGLGLVALAAACAPSDASYLEAVRAEWPSEQVEQRGRAGFYADQAKEFEQSSRRSAEISASLGADDKISVAHREAALDARASADEARYLARSELVGVKDVRCAGAAPIPGENCEMTIIVRGPDGMEHELPASWRFDRVKGKLRIVGSARR